MSVNTTADECLSEAQQHVSAAIQSISKIVVDKCHGADHFSPVYWHKLQAILPSLIAIRDILEE